MPSQTWNITGHHQRDPIHNHAILQAITIHPQTQQMFSAGMHVEEENVLSYMGIDFSVRRLNQLKVGKPESEDKTTGNKWES